MDWSQLGIEAKKSHRMIPEREANYNAAIWYYNAKKNEFIRLIQISSKRAAAMRANEIVKQIVNIDTYIEKGKSAQEIGVEKAEELLEQAVKEIFEGETMKKEYADMEKKADKNVDKLKEALKKELENENSNLYRSLIKNEFLKEEIKSGNGKRTIGQIAGYIAKMALESKPMSNATYRGYISALKGYYAEQAINDALNKILREIYGVAENKNFFEVKGGANEISDLKVTLEAITGTKKVVGYSDPVEFGLQAKPFDVNKIGSGEWLAKSFHLTGNKGLLEKMPKEESFVGSYTATTWYLSHFIKQIIGENNILYSTSGEKLIWTGALIKKFVRNKYYLCFESTAAKDGSGKITYTPTSGITWKVVPSSAEA